ncbi:conserved Plasmodium protein, unknown function [Plasmodium knowlesi strain H]|uniref:TRIP4/RQT4 C2HC5-type zinc finger domain-containing protein n=3 Tax=Plasmodium knowlesi TaxID=5850 RepID=A0A5K1VEW1_PLAKH|nr:zinc finger protein, putative [Plasmodium knowlesi strain H]OTN66316.1 Uncharacterized protein PKNOH_S09534900 [Plasmodium knowlesi]CAA9989958.1 zinc finger protein, putative [Plasmodium knowlesi strain H]SBO24540.1 conserved Plasmodium protein, unknown function [Plasmodium knowlesi strain H]SBO26383.1 conserved Plasmodium protein, unknown function [Plasmodium knowlesi strain H]VVS79432.1 zinc finger protein, putative [Plasmodium knowlesi strain H]|eukprot:XP_002259973.1 hypothetical protein, conserved in Plasmodium species [Plasmodium knowlesi strain H]
MDEKDKYANHIRRKIIKFFNLKNEELDPSYIKSILNCKSYDLYGSIYLLNESFYENGRNEKCTLSTVKKFTQDLVDDRKKFISSNESDSIGRQTPEGVSYGKITNHGAIAGDGLTGNIVEGKTINSYFEEVFKREDVQTSRKERSKVIPKEDKHGKVFLNRDRVGKVKKVGQMEEDQKKDQPKGGTNDAISHGGEHPLDEAVRLEKVTKQKKTPTKGTKEKNNEREDHIPNGNKSNGVFSQKGKEKETQGKEPQRKGATKLEVVEHKHKEVRPTQLEDEQAESKMNSKEKAECDYFEFFNMKKNSYSLKTVINFIENEQAKGDEQDEYEKEEQKKEKKKKKNTHICTCNGRNHQVYANCLICGKIYCTKIKYRQCLFCGNILYDTSLINKLFTPTEDGDNANKKILTTMKDSNPFLYKNYFDPSNAFLKKAFNLRDKMLKNSVNEEHTKIIDDSIDWFEDDIKKEFDNPDVHFSNYDDEVKNEIIDKYYEIFGKKYGDINIDIDLVNMKITENKDHGKIKEFNDYLNERENEYRNEIALKKANGINPSNVHSYLANKERKNLNYIKDLRKLFFRDTSQKGGVPGSNTSTDAIAAGSIVPPTEQQENTNLQMRKASKKYKCHVLGESDEEYEQVT